MKEDSNKGKSNEKVEKSDSKFSSTRNFIKKLDFSQIDPDEEHKMESKPKKEESKNESHALPTVDDFLKVFKVKDVKSGKNKLKVIIGLVAGSLLIVGGIYLLLAPVENVADNVIFGEHAVFSVFLILIGIIVIAVALAPKFMDKSFFKGINTQLDSDKEVSSHQDEKNIRKDNINKDNR